MTRRATPEELAIIYPPVPGYETIAFVFEEDGEITGHVCLSRALGQIFGHDMLVRSADRTAAFRLWRAAKRQAINDWNAKRVLIHFERPDDPLIPFWESQGFRRSFTVYEGEI